MALFIRKIFNGEDLVDTHTEKLIDQYISECGHRNLGEVSGIHLRDLQYEELDIPESQ